MQYIYLFTILISNVFSSFDVQEHLIVFFLFKRTTNITKHYL
jgi:hypothetical protein